MSSISAPPSSLFSHCPRCAEPRTAEADAVRFVCDPCGFVYYYNVAVSSAVLIAAADGSCLFIRRARDPGKNKLGLPGGFVDRGESGEHAAIREVREEVGVQLESVTFLASFPNLYVYREVEYPVLDLFFVARVPSRIGRALDDVTAVVWVNPRSLAEADFAFPSHVRALQQYLTDLASDGC